MKKIMFVIMFILMISLTSAWDWDNVKDYDEDEREITIINALGFGEDIAKIRLNTPTIQRVIRGEDRLVAEFTMENYELYSDVFNDMKFYNINRGMDEFEREFTYKFREYYEVEVIDYEFKFFKVELMFFYSHSFTSLKHDTSILFILLL